MYAFSIVIPIYNSSTYIEKNLISNISRIDKNDRYEIILVDDCSADIEKIKQIINKYENIFVIEKEKKSNAADSRNIGFLNSKYDLVLFVDSDDFFLDNYYQRRDQLHKSTKAGVVFGDFLLNMHGKIFQKNLPNYMGGDTRDYLFGMKGDIRSSTISIFKPYFNQSLFDPLSAKHQDWIFGIRIFDNNEKIYFDNQPYSQINVLNNQRMSSSYNLNASKYLIKTYLGKQEHINSFSRNHWVNLLANYNKEARDFYFNMFIPLSLKDRLFLIFYKSISSEALIVFTSKLVLYIKRVKWFLLSKK